MDPLQQVLHSHNEYMRLVLGTDGYRELIDNRNAAATSIPEEYDPNAEFFAKVEEDEKAGRYATVVVMGQVARTTQTEYEAGKYEGKARLATDDEVADERERSRVLHELQNLQPPSSPLSS